MYKIFFKDRIVLLTDRIDSDLTNGFDGIHKLGSDGELKRFLSDFESNEDRQQAVIYHYNEHELFQRFRNCYKNLLAAGGLIWNSEKTHFLSICRLGRPDLPKGKVEKEESFKEAAIREVKEECGIRNPEIIAPLAPSYHVYHLGGQAILKETRWFEMIYHGNSAPIPQTEENITEINWISTQEAKEFAKKTYPSIKEILKKRGLV